MLWSAAAWGVVDREVVDQMLSASAMRMGGVERVGDAAVLVRSLVAAQRATV
jgi:hypothetical protein